MQKKNFNIFVVHLQHKNILKNYIILWLENFVKIHKIYAWCKVTVCLIFISLHTHTYRFV